MHMMWEVPVSGLMATSCDFEPVVDKRHFAGFQDTWLLSACITQPQLEVHVAGMPHYVVSDDCRESGQRCGLSVVGVNSAAFARRPPTCLGDVSFRFSVCFVRHDRLCRLPYFESTGGY